MNEKPTYELKGTLREDCMKDIATPLSRKTTAFIRQDAPRKNNFKQV
ncbi:MAG TPA: hypothetical protein IAD18_05585 [Candidatus Limisoma intestinavium]|uniref:Uncharacterized protein n=1 Tax=Candidatus Limisoma intestinavium TaxID=2840856 RepID=A0A9D1INQ9_9BACT|nr:hypothetical protein [Candidatus Limisoma intestinavium]